VFIYDSLFARFASSISHYGYTRICNIGHYLNIDSAGNVMPCLFASLRFGNALNKPLEEIYMKMVEETSKLRDSENLKGRCKVCKYRYICGGCRVGAFELAGDWFAPDPLCNYNPCENGNNGIG